MQLVWALQTFPEISDSHVDTLPSVVELKDSWLAISKGSEMYVMFSSLLISMNELSKIIKEIVMENLIFHWNLQRKKLNSFI